jgi:hypothetical protein
MSKSTRQFTVLSVAVALLLGSLACAPEVGSDAWCEKMSDTPKGEWSANDAGSFAKNCVFK